MEESAQSLLKASMKQLHLSALAFHRILKLGRTIADLENADIIKAHQPGRSHPIQVENDDIDRPDG